MHWHWSASTTIRASRWTRSHWRHGCRPSTPVTTRPWPGSCWSRRISWPRPAPTSHLSGQLRTRGVGRCAGRDSDPMAAHRACRRLRGGGVRLPQRRCTRHALHHGWVGVPQRVRGARHRHGDTEREDAETVDRIIFSELVDGSSATRREAYRGVIERLRDRGCDAVALACTEIPLLVRASDSPLPTLDSTRLLAAAALREALALNVSAGSPYQPSRRIGVSSG